MKKLSNSILNNILSHLSDFLDKIFISINNQFKSLDHLTIRINVIEEYHSKYNSRNYSFASKYNKNKQTNNISIRALEFVFLNSRKQRERKAEFQSIFDDNSAYISLRIISS
jgi:hypothetical protein